MTDGRRPRLNIDPPKMSHGEADRLAEFSARVGLPLVPWQCEFLRRLEAASMDKQFGEIIAKLDRG